MRFVMDTNSHSSITEKLTDVFDWLTQKRRQAVAPQTTNTLYPEMNDFKRNLSSNNTPTRPSRAIRKFEALEPVTEQQKIMDLAG